MLYRSLYIILLSCCVPWVIHGMIAQKQQSSGYQVQKSFYETYQGTQPQGFTVYWLFLPHYNDYVLIQTPGSKEPRINADGTPQFRYVDPTYTTQRGYAPLPSGLYCWRSDYEPKIGNKAAQAHLESRAGSFETNAVIVRHQPGGTAFARLKNKAQYGPFSGGSQWNPAGHTHIPGTRAQMLALTSQQRIDASQKPSTITLVTANTLAEHAYQYVLKNILPQQVPQQNIAEQMPLPLRQYYVRNARNNPYLMKNADFICVQEWDQQLAKGISGYGYIGHQVLNQNRKMTSALFYDNTRWKLQVHEILRISDKDAVVATFSDTKRQDQRYVTVASCHIPGGAGLDQQAQYIHKVRNVAERQSQQHNNADILVAGDFNCNTYANQLYGYPPSNNNVKNVNNLSQTINAQTTTSYIDAAQTIYARIRNQQLPSSAAPSYPHLLPTSYNQGFERMDYIWFTGKLQPIQYHMFPLAKDLWHVIQHTKGQPPHYSYHFSDHATIRTVFQYQ